MSIFRKKSLASLFAQLNDKGADTLKRTLDAKSLIALGIGAIIGAGLFVRTAAAAGEAAGPGRRAGDVLLLASCERRAVRSMLQDAAHDAKRQLRLIERRSQARDHPILAAMPETRYLKCVIAQVV